MGSPLLLALIVGVVLFSVITFFIREHRQRVLIPFDELPMGAWFRIDINGKPGLGTAMKTYDRGGEAPGKQFIQIGNENVWWIKNYQPPEGWTKSV